MNLRLENEKKNKPLTALPPLKPKLHIDFTCTQKNAVISIN